jgi:hypothetical protein
VDISGGKRWGGEDEVVVVVGRYIHKYEAEEGAEGQNYEIEPLGLDSGRAVGKGGSISVGETVGRRR